VKKSDREEPIWVGIYMCMEATLGISVQLSLSQTSKNAMFFLLYLMFSLQQNQRTRFCPEVQGGGWYAWVAQIMYTHVSKCKKRLKKKNNSARTF
jgi:hypothetical protein